MRDALLDRPSSRSLIGAAATGGYYEYRDPADEPIEASEIDGK